MKERNMKTLFATVAAILVLTSPVMARGKKVPECELAENGAGKYCTSDDKLDHETMASNHGYYTAALEVMCEGALVISDEALKAKHDKLYRDNPKWRRTYMEAYEGVVSRKQAIDERRYGGKRSMLSTPEQDMFITCFTAGGADAADGEKRWLIFEGRDKMEAAMNLANEKWRAEKAVTKWDTLIDEKRKP